MAKVEIDDVRVAATEPAPQVIRLPDVPADPIPKVRRPRLGADFARLWGATTISSVGDGVRVTALPLLAAVFTRNPMLVSGILFASKLPWLLFSLPAGALADRIDRRRLVVYVNVGRGVVMGGLFVAAAAGTNALWLLYGVAFLQGIGEVVSDNTAFAMLPSLVDKSGLERANGLLEASVITGTAFAGPALGGVLFAAAVALPFGLDAATFGLAAALFFAIRYRPPAVSAKSKTRMRADISEGLQWLRGHALLRNLSVLAALTNFVLHATFGIQVLFALEILHVHAAGFGLLLSIEAVGALSGSLLAARLRARLGTTACVVLALFIAAAGNLAVATTSSVVFVAAMWMVVSFTGGLWTVVTNSLRQSLVPDRLLGRVQSAHRLLSWGAIPVGTLFGGALAEAWGLRAPFFVAAGSLLVLTAAAHLVLRRSPAPAT